MKDLNTALTMDRKSYSIYNERGIAYFELNKYDLAIKDFNQVLALNPRYSQAYVNRGTAKTKVGEYSSAIDDFTKAAGIDPKNAFAYLSRGTVYMTYFKNPKKACADWKRSCELGQCRNYNLAKMKRVCE